MTSSLQPQRGSDRFPTYRHWLVPGPTKVHPEVLEVYGHSFPSSDVEEEFYMLYERTQRKVARVLQIDDHENAHSKDSVVIMTGEAMLALWGALKSVLKPGDKVLSVANGIYGHGVAEMAKSLGATVEVVEFAYDETWNTDGHQEKIMEAALRFQPKLITAIHCETPSGILNHIEYLGVVSRRVDALLYVDFVSSGAAAPVKVSEWSIDLGLLGSQKALSMFADTSIVTVSDKAWKEIDAVNYVGYDALKPWRGACKGRFMPYTPHWNSLQALEIVIDKLESEGLDQVFARHARVSEYTRKRLREIGVVLHPSNNDAICSPSVTAAYLPDGIAWKEFANELRKVGLGLSGSFGKLEGKVFRIGHMGLQADLQKVSDGLDALELVLKALSNKT